MIDILQWFSEDRIRLLGLAFLLITITCCICAIILVSKGMINPENWD